MAHIKHHHAKRLPAAGDGKKRGCFLFLVSAVIVFLFILLPFWLLYKRSVKPPAPESFGPAAPAEPGQPADPNPEPKRKRPKSDEDKPLRFR